MPHPSRTQAERRAAIRRMLQSAPAATQQSLVQALTTQGFAATQSSVSRDLRELGALKSGDGYRLAASGSGAGDDVARVAGLLRGLQPAGPHLLVIRTAIGAAQRVALALDRCGWQEIVGNVGGDDTVFVATASGADQRRLIANIKRAVAHD